MPLMREDDVSHLGFRILRGVSDKDFETMTDTPEVRRIIQLAPLSGSGMFGKSGYDMLLQIGYDPKSIEGYVRAGKKFKMVIFELGPDSPVKRATWVNVTEATPASQGSKKKSSSRQAPHVGWVVFWGLAMLGLLMLLWRGCPPPQQPLVPDHAGEDANEDAASPAVDDSGADQGRDDGGRPSDAGRPDAGKPAPEHADGGTHRPDPQPHPVPPLATADMAQTAPPKDAGLTPPTPPAPSGPRYPTGAQDRAWRIECGSLRDYIRCRDRCLPNATTRQICEDLYGPNRFD